MRFPLLPLAAALALPLPASAAELTLEEFGALHPDEHCFTMHPELSRIGMTPYERELGIPAFVQGRGGSYRVTDLGDISFVAGPWNYGSLGYEHLTDSLSAFISEHGNDYDFISLFTSEHLQFGALYSPQQNDTYGIGMPIFNNTQVSYSELEGYLFMNGIFDYTGSQHDALFFGQEVGHRWSSYVRRAGGGQDMLGRDEAHWSFWMDTDNSTMEGNNWEVLSNNSNRWETNFDIPVGYSELDLYLMGFMDPDEVDPWLLIGNPSVISNPYDWGEGNIQPSTTPYYVIQQYVDNGDSYPVVVQGSEITVEIEDVTSVNGSRSPDHTEAQRDFRMAFVIMHPDGEELSFDDYLVIEDTREQLAILWEDMVENRAELTTTLGGTEHYDLDPSGLPADVVWEPEAVDAGAGCQASIAAGGAASLALLLPMIGVVRRRR